MTEDQHFVPRFYIKKFSNNNFIRVLDLGSGKILRPYPYSGVCYEKFYYAQKTGVADNVSQEIEGLFTTLENLVSLKYEGICKKLETQQQIDNNERYILSLFFSMLWIRGKYMRYQINKTTSEMLKQSLSFMAEERSFSDDIKKHAKNIGKNITDKEIENMRRDCINKKYKIECDNSIHINLITKFENFANLFFYKNWTVYINKSDTDFITSDNPVVEYFPREIGCYGLSFLEREHYIALNTKIVIKAVMPISGKKLKRKDIYNQDQELVLELNRLRAEHSISYCYSKEIKELEFLVKYRQFRLNNVLSVINQDIQ